jgi:hypothetical protein
MRRREFVPKTSTRTRSAGGAAAPARPSERGEVKSAPGHNLVGPDWSGDARVRYVRLYRRRKPIAFPASPRACQNRGRAPSQN